MCFNILLLGNATPNLSPQSVALQQKSPFKNNLHFDLHSWLGSPVLLRTKEGVEKAVLSHTAPKETGHFYPQARCTWLTSKDSPATFLTFPRKLQSRQFV